MTSLSILQESHTTNPLDVIERLVDDQGWPFDRQGDLEMAVQIPGKWCDYNLYFSWNEEASAIHFTAAFDMRVPQERRPETYELLALLNEKMWLGHFGIWASEGVPMYRYALPLRGVGDPSFEQMEDLIEVAVLECERFYPAFQYVVWGGKSATDAVEAAMLDTVGEA